MFLHGSFFHIAGNMLYLWIFGNNVEDTLGHGRFILFYLASGVAAAATQTMVSPDSPVPMIGASGAVSGVLGAYFLLFPHANVLTLVIFGFFWRIVSIPALVVLGFWMLVQILNGLGSFGAGGGVPGSPISGASSRGWGSSCCFAPSARRAPGSRSEGLDGPPSEAFPGARRGAPGWILPGSPVRYVLVICTGT